MGTNYEQIDNRVLRKLQRCKTGRGRIYYLVCIPKQLVDAFDWKGGDFLTFKITKKGHLEVYKAPKHDYLKLVGAKRGI